MSGHKRIRRGVAAVEFAIVAPVFFFLVLGLVEIGRMVMLQQALTNAAREGCRTAGLASSIDAATIDTRVRDYLQSVVGTTAFDVTKVRITAPATLTNVPSGTDLIVAVELNYADATWLPLGLLGLNPTIAAERSANESKPTWSEQHAYEQASIPHQLWFSPPRCRGCGSRPRAAATRHADYRCRGCRAIR